jgi:5-(carboxyamino)imidazole ribonucleotide mutase
MARGVNRQRTTSAPGRRASGKPPADVAGGGTVGIVMGSDSDWETMREAARVLRDFDVPFESRVVSAHRTPRLLYEYAESAAARGISCVIAGAGGAAHLPGMLAAMTAIPVLGVPVRSRHLQGMDSLLSIVQMPRGVPVATFAIGEAGAANAALFAAAMLGMRDAGLAERLRSFRAAEAARIATLSIPELS